MTTDRNCLSYWFPKLAAASVPVPRTEIIRFEDGRDGWTLADLCDGKTPDGFDRLIEDLRSAAFRIGAGPWFLRTGQGSGKHDWSRCCYLTDLDKLPHHVAALVEWSHLVDMLGLRHDVWCVREFLPTEPVATLPGYGGMPLVKEVRGFVKGGKVVCVHPYWPMEAIQQGFGRDADMNVVADTLERITVSLGEIGESYKLLTAVAKTFDGDGAWSVDVLATKRGWYVTDMAIAERSFHWDGCEAAKLFQ